MRNVRLCVFGIYAENRSRRKQSADGKITCAGRKNGRNFGTLQARLVSFSRRGEKENVKIETKLPDYTSAPVKAGDTVGEMIVYKDDVEIDRVPLVAGESAEKAGFGDRFKAITGEWKF